jgi:hypothetical protein
LRFLLTVVRRRKTPSRHQRTRSLCEDRSRGETVRSWREGYGCG